MPAAETQPDAAIGHGEVESALKALAVRQVSSLWGRTVFRVSLFHWSVADGEPLLLLPAIDRLMRRRRLDFGPQTGQDSAIASSAD
jgi:hypothetical protein